MFADVTARPSQFSLSSGGDSDTIAAIYGQLAGAFYGFEAIPAEWRGCVPMSRSSRPVTEFVLTMAVFSPCRSVARADFLIDTADALLDAALLASTAAHSARAESSSNV